MELVTTATFPRTEQVSGPKLEPDLGRDVPIDVRPATHVQTFGPRSILGEDTLGRRRAVEVTVHIVVFKKRSIMDYLSTDVGSHTLFQRHIVPVLPAEQ